MSDTATGSARRTSYDVAIVGGGINGVGIARDAAGRGLSVLLCEQDDLAQHTSSASTKLIHGGLRYLEHYEFGLVRKALQEREVLLRAAPHIMWPLRFVMPHDATMRPEWMIRAGLLLYDHLARRRMLPGSSGIDLRTHPAGAPLREGYTRGFVYSDGWVDDARLVVLNAVDAAARGADILTGTRCVGAVRDTGSDHRHWRLTLQPRDGAPAFELSARALVNAAGPWVGSLLTEQLGLACRHRLRQVKGSHIVVPRLFDHPFAYIFQNPDRRIVFAIPYEQRFTLIGTTDVEFRGDVSSVGIDAEEIDYLCASASRYFRRSVGAADVVWSYAGVRPLLDDEAGEASAVTRDYTFELDTAGAPLLSVFGGKITTFRKLAEQAVTQVQQALGVSPRPWTATAALPGGDIADADFDAFVRRELERLSWLPEPLVRRWARAYGTRIDRILGDARAAADLGREIAPGVYEAELEYLWREEWARSGDDVLWRRSKLGLHLDERRREAIARWMSARSGASRAMAASTDGPPRSGVAERTLRHYETNADAFWAGTRDHDVTQNIDALLAHIDAPAPLTILDFGCGPGRDLKAFRDRGHVAIGVEGAARFAEMARAHSGCEVWQQDFLALELPERRFDGVFANASLFHVPGTDIARVLRELCACLKPGGVLLSSNPRGENVEGWNGERYGAYWNLERWRELMQSAGFEELDHYFRPPGKPREQQPWLVTVWRRPREDA